MLKFLRKTDEQRNRKAQSKHIAQMNLKKKFVSHDVSYVARGILFHPFYSSNDLHLVNLHTIPLDYNQRVSIHGHEE